MMQVRAPILGILVLLACAAPAAAHPGIGIVMNRQGVVFYTDLTHVWRIGTDGTKSIAVRNVHTHELYLAPDGTLHGEHLWAVGERWYHYTWTLSPQGIVTKSPSREGFRQHSGFVRDAAGRQYWYESLPTPAIVRRAADGREVRLGGRATFTDVRWMTSAADGTVYFTDNGDLRQMAPDGTVRTLAPGVRDRADHWVGGVWVDERQRVYVALWGGRSVKRFDPQTRAVEIVATSPAPWGPSGGFTAPNGDLWLLETAQDNTVRVRRLAPDGRERIY